MSTRMKSTFIVVNFLLCTLLVFWSCSKTEYEQTKSPYHEILGFRIAAANSGVDSLSAIIAGDSISIYWDQLIETPATITPVIKVSKGATISPASGVSVDFSENTVYTVTAEDGSSQQYRLKPIFNVPIPVVSSFKTTYAVAAWGHAVPFSQQNMTIEGVRSTYFFMGDQQTDETVKMYNPALMHLGTYPLESVVEKHRVIIEGEYFLTGQGGRQDFRVFLRRLKDGFEVETPIEILTENRVTALFPDYSSELDTGLHQLFFQMNGREFAGSEINIGAPAPGYIKGDFKFHQQGQLIHVGDDIKLTFSNMHDDYEGSILRFYGLDKLLSIEYAFTVDGGRASSTGNIRTGDFEVNGNDIIHKVPEWMRTMDMSVMKIRSISIVYPYVDRRGTTGYNQGKKTFPMPIDALNVAK